ncbi:hypothetical protein BDW59DRAFT_147599 [Aspergillus cavernicola]|uniref:Receptor L-domain domain-containing protein n=1 Tax=Aspergillus cavernicola TaxID=176166 RepID=A0ABR4I9J0_9EURO
MKYFNIGLATVLSICNLPLGVLAQDCETSETTDPETGETLLRLTSPDQLEVFRDGCTTITGDILIESTYSGDIILDGITKFDGSIYTAEDSPAQGLGLVELVDLVEFGSLLLHLVTGVNLPKLDHAVDILLVQSGLSGEANLGALVEVNNLKVQGSWTSINLASLKTVNQEIGLCAIEGCQILPDENPPPIAVDLPLLESANKFEVAGTVESVSIPNLSVLGDREPETANNQGLRINIQGSHNLDVDAPSLHTLNGTIEVYGSVASVSLGALGETTVGATLNARAPLNFYSTIQTAQYFYVWGELESIYLPDLVDLGSISLSYEPRLPCNETLYELWQSVPDYGNDQSRCHEIEV